MKWNIPRPRARARLVASLVMASAVSLLSVASAGAQSLKPTDGSVPARTCYARAASQYFSYALMLGGLAASAFLLLATS